MKGMNVGGGGESEALCVGSDWMPGCFMLHVIEQHAHVRTTHIEASVGVHRGGRCREARRCGAVASRARGGADEVRHANVIIMTRPGAAWLAPAAAAPPPPPAAAVGGVGRIGVYVWRTLLCLWGGGGWNNLRQRVVRSSHPRSICVHLVEAEHSQNDRRRKHTTTLGNSLEESIA